METKKSMIPLLAASPEEIQEALPVPSDLYILAPSHTDPFDPVVPAIPPGYDVPPGFNMEVPIDATPISFAFGEQNKPGRVRKGKTPISDETTATKKAKLMVRSLRGDLALLASSSNAGPQPRAHAEAILATFDALRRRLEQIIKADGVNNRPDMKAEMIMKANGLMANRMKRVGSVPGVEVGDIFYFRMEMCVVGLHSRPMEGIDYMKDGTNRIAIAIVSSGRYDNEDDDVGKMVYTGQGGNGRKKEQIGDQKLERGNYAMEQSKIGENLIRVIRSRKDPFIRGNKIYIYDGLYKIKKSKTKNSKLGFKTFNFKLVREEGQPDGFAIWKMTEKWKKEPASRGKVLTSDLSTGVESIPVTVMNEVDDEPTPNNFLYVTTIAHGQNLRAKDQVPAGCQCKKLCIPTGAADCYCASENGGWLPYSSSGLLTKRLPLLYECGSGCVCTVNCQNRVTHRGVKLHFEVFRTENRGWGLRSWDPIRAGSFVCEFVGEYLENPCPDSKELVLNEYVFCATHPGEKAVKWNLGMELATEGQEKCYEPELILVPVPMISSKEIGNVSRFINHSCDPNLFWQLVRYGHGDGQYTGVMFFATKHIPPMTELTYDYNGNTDGRRGRVGAKQCLCGAPNCQGYFG
ncbi:histone-lysine N-methyltransferase, H3 lysine-9 specific SUVH1-like isoform X2 [Carex littledalei]|uniref:Histone-lysine N-methyltransferase, H3 lysine-9 specific SUVH1-like isoform X2 n=1 Tax=Carex littledalei TaxID=544730 RepID=A0A833RQ47_9POAL|nr:histone-lysine N-methyltransferase, H3 lysine-9 specific SUVH1-like isoform X2 [Carex littledalei]